MLHDGGAILLLSPIQIIHRFIKMTGGNRDSRVYRCGIIMQQD